MAGLLAAGSLGEGVRAVLFDFDGTLVDSNVQTSLAISDLLAQRGYQKDPHEIGEYLGSGTLENALDLWFGIPDDEQQQFFTDLRPLMFDHYLKDAPTIEPVPALHALDLLGMAPSDVIFVGDNETDVNCAVEAGIPAVVAIAGADKAARLATLGASHVRSNLHAVSDLLLHSSQE